METNIVPPVFKITGRNLSTGSSASLNLASSAPSTASGPAAFFNPPPLSFGGGFGPAMYGGTWSVSIRQVLAGNPFSQMESGACQNWTDRENRGINKFNRQQPAKPRLPGFVQKAVLAGLWNFSEFQLKARAKK